MSVNTVEGWSVSERSFRTTLLALGPSRRAVIVGSVVLFHLAALWALQSGLLRRAAEVVVPVEVIGQVIDPPRLPSPPAPIPRRKVTQTAPSLRPQAIRRRTPAPDAPLGTTEPPPAPLLPAPPAPAAAPVASASPAAIPPAPRAPEQVELSQGQVRYVHAPAVVYPAMSRKLNETGRVIVTAYFNRAGDVKRAEVSTSSGFERLDRAAVEAVKQSRITPIPGGNEGTEYTFHAPINFVLSQ